MFLYIENPDKSTHKMRGNIQLQQGCSICQYIK